MTDRNGFSPAIQSPLPSSRVSKQQRSESRKYGFACSNCRRRKAKCDGGFPACQKCVVAHEQCNYEKRPSVAFAVTLQHQLKAYQDRFEQLREAKDDEREALLAEPITVGKPRGGKARASSPSDTNQLTLENTTPESSSVETSADVDTNALPEETSIGADGHVYFYGKTSLYHIDPQANHQDDSRSTITTTPSSPHGNGERNEMAAFLSEIQIDVLNELLDTYWCWPHHLHNVLCKKVFLRDLNALGPCISPFLLSAVLAQAARFSTRADATELSDRFAKRALRLLINDIDRGSTIPAIQGLLIFSARECACGRTSQGWLYSGMAIRMARDLGLHVAPKKLGPLSSHFSDEDLALRQQVFWSCYTWDKTMSLCLGRAPIMPDTIELPTTETLLDGHDADDEIWHPVSVQSPLSESLLRQRALSSTRFAVYCDLCIIIHGILDKLYSRPHPAQPDHMLAYLTQTVEQLDSWSSRLPLELLVKEDTKAALCPPLHILLLNLLYHTAVILLCRPYRTISTTARDRCTKAARMTDTLFTLHVRRFGFRFVTWLQTYTMFVACTINVLDFKDSLSQDRSIADPALAQEASARLGFGLEVLRQTGSTPSATRCASIIEQLLQNLSGTAKDSDGMTQHQQTNSHERGLGLSWRDGFREQLSKPVSNGNEHGKAPLPLARKTTSHNLAINHHRTPNNFDQHTTLRPTENVIRDTAPPPYQNELMLSSVQSLADDLTSFNPDLNGSGIDIPFRWLPENVCDDGSWMLMDIDFNSWSN